MSYETDELKREIGRLSLELHDLRNNQGRDRERAQNAVQTIEMAQIEILDLTRRLGELEQRAGAIEEAMPSSTAELLALASTRMAGLLGALAYNEATTVRKLETAVERLPSRTITTNGSPYLTRWYLWPEGPRDSDDDENHYFGERSEHAALPFAMFLHKFHRGDADRDQHNHPWDLSVAVVLAGGYREERGDQTRVVLPGSVNVIRGDDFHRVDLLNPSMGSWSLFVAGSKTCGWGFRDKITGAFIPQKDYLAAKGSTE